jgi:hypothetical protein
LYTAAQYNEVSAHELGHTVDIVFGGESQNTGNSSFTTYVLDDFFDMDYLDAAGTQDRPPCNAVNGVTAPYAGITDLTTGQPFCGQGNGYDPATGIEQKYLENGQAGQPEFNSVIAQTVEVFFRTKPNPNNPQWYPEVYAQTFGYDAYGNQLGQATSARPMMDAMFGNGYFACSRGWTGSRLANGTAPPNPVPVNAPLACGTAVPNGYTP